MAVAGVVAHCGKLGPGDFSELLIPPESRRKMMMHASVVLWAAALSIIASVAAFNPIASTYATSQRVTSSVALYSEPQTDDCEGDDGGRRLFLEGAAIAAVASASAASPLWPPGAAPADHCGR